MQYFVTIYIDTMKPKLDFIPLTIPHAFLGLTHTHPDELDSQSDIEIEKYSNLQSLYGGIIWISPYTQISKQS